MTRKVSNRHANVARREYIRGNTSLECATDGCTRVAYCKGLCCACYQRLVRIQRENNVTWRKPRKRR